MNFAKEEFMQKVSSLEKLLEEDFGSLAVAVRKGGSGGTAVRHSQKLVEQLQYHDIIRQKIQHVGQFADIIEKEFCSHRATTAEFSILPSLLELSMALLQFARLEYDEIREEIKLQLAAMSLKNIQLDTSYLQFQQEVQEAIKSLGRMYLQIDCQNEGQEAGDLSAEQLRVICQSFSMQTEREIFRSLFNRELLPQDLQQEEGSDNIELF